MEEGIVFTIRKISDAHGYMAQPEPLAYKIDSTQKKLIQKLLLIKLKYVSEVR